MEKPTTHYENDDASSPVSGGKYDLECPVQLETKDENPLTEDHRQYLLQRHGTVDLDPMPDMTDADPYNWPTWKVHTKLLDARWITPTNSLSRIEIPQSGNGRVPCDDGDLHRGCDSVRLRGYSRRPRRQRSPSKLLDLPGHCGPGCCSSYLDATLESIRTTAHLPSVPDMQSGRQRGLCEELLLCNHGVM
ncbi:unnamed protein product [Aspergillus oryzae]|nr:unnamed protein product [Aspergillus oryzae]